MVNRRMTEREDISDLIGGQPFSVMYNNHHDHAALLCEVLRNGNYLLLAKMVIWAYRTYLHRGFPLRYFRIVLPLWQEAVSERLPRRYAPEVNDVYDWILRHHEDVAELAQEPFLSTPMVESPWRDAQRAFLQGLLEGDSATCLAAIDTVIGTMDGLPSVFEQIVRPSLYEIGELWQAGEISISREHLASATATTVLAVLQSQIAGATAPCGRVLFSAAQNELHEIGASMVATTLRMDGWHVDFLGANTPVEDMVDFARQTPPDIVAVSIAMPYNLAQGAALCRSIRAAPECHRTRIMVGGLALQYVADPLDYFGADGTAADSTEAVALARS
jgi:MerR family transcriptional regulator, light-induced transcriptional regulator